MKNKYLFLILTSGIIISFSSCLNKKSEGEGEKNIMVKDTTKPKINPYAKAEIEIRVYKNDTVKNSNLHGYGYDIYIFKSLNVHQPHIPAINGNRGFDTEVQAHKAAEFIVYKIRNNIMPPSVTPAELDSLGVLTVNR